MEWSFFTGVHSIVYIFIFISRSKNKRFNIKKQKNKAAKCKKLTAKRGGGFAALLRGGSAPGPKAPSCVSTFS